MASTPAAFAGILDDIQKSSEEVIQDTTDYIEENVGDEAKEGVDKVFKKEKSEQSPPEPAPSAEIKF